MESKLSAAFKRSLFGQILNELRNRDSITHKIIPRYPRNSMSVSDLFIGGPKDLKTVFAAENILALSTGNAVPIRHKFVYVDPDGKVVKIDEVVTSEPFYIHQLEHFSSGYFTFLHLTESLNLDIDAKNAEYRQHRGLTGYMRNKNDLVHYVHGNIGALYVSGRNNLKSLVKQRNQKTYTIQEDFREGMIYDFVVTNPTARELQLTIKGFNAKKILNRNISLTIKPFGLSVFNNHGEDSILSFTSKLTVTRPIIFESNADYSQFNVYHS
jgi:hypothetical protein